VKQKPFPIPMSGKSYISGKKGDRLLFELLLDLNPVREVL